MGLGEENEGGGVLRMGGMPVYVYISLGLSLLSIGFARRLEFCLRLFAVNWACRESTKMQMVI